MNNKHQITIDILSVITNFKKNINTFTTLIKLLNYKKIIIIIKNLKSIYKYIQD